MDKINLAVFFGGRSCEHDVSIITGLQAMHNADPLRYNVIPVYVAHNGAWYRGRKLREADFFRSFNENKVERCHLVKSGDYTQLIAWPPKKRLFGGGVMGDERIDVALPCFHGMNGEDGTIQGLFELYNLPYTSAGILGSSLGMDKIAQKALLRGCGISVLPMCWIGREEWIKNREGVLKKIEEELPYPLYVKPANLGSSIGISRADDRAGLSDAIDIAVSFDRRILIDQGLEKPTEINCSALGFGENIEASLCEMPVSWQEFLTFEDKYLRGGKNDKGWKRQKSGGMAGLQRRIPAPIGEKMTTTLQSQTVNIFRILDLKGVVRVDYLIDKASGTLYVNEVNTIPGSLAFYLWEPKGISFPQLIDRIVECAFQAQHQKEQSVYTYDSNLLRGFAGVKG